MFQKYCFQKLSFIILAVIFFGGLSTFVYALQPVGGDAEEKIAIVIKPGDGLHEISRTLDEQRLIKSTSAFNFYSLLSGQAHIIKPGNYSLSPSWNVAQLMKMLVIGPPDIRVVVKEGSTVLDIDTILSDDGVIKPGELAQYDWQYLKEKYEFIEKATTLEGFLFPDTYHFSPLTPIHIVVTELLDNFKKQAWQYLRDKDDAYTALIAASLIEKEAPFNNDRQIIAGIMEKRMRNNIPLQIDASTIYSKCEKRFFTCDARTRRLSRTDLDKESEYSTYSQRGLPPTPISNPSLNSIQAALNPQRSPYLYYISHPQTRRTIFAATLDEHNTNRAQYLR